MGQKDILRDHPELREPVMDEAKETFQTIDEACAYLDRQLNEIFDLRQQLGDKEQLYHRNCKEIFQQLFDRAAQAPVTGRELINDTRNWKP
jgi:hypothetical protein